MIVRAQHRRIIEQGAFWSVVAVCAAGVVTSAGAAHRKPQTQQEARLQLETFLKTPAFTGKAPGKAAGTSLYYMTVSPFSYSFIGGGAVVLSRDFKKVASMDKPVKSGAYPYATFVQNTDGSNLQEALLGLDLVNPLDFSPSSIDLLLIGSKGQPRGTEAVSRLWNYRLADGSVTRISPPDLFVYGGRYSPDGRTVAFVGANFNPDTVAEVTSSPSKSPQFQDTAAVFLIGTDGSGLKRLRRGNSALCWSPSGKQLAFVCEGAGTTPQYQEIWSVDVSTGKSHRILQMTGLSRLRSADRENSKLFARYTFYQLVWLNENELLAEVAWGDRASEVNGIVRFDTSGRITAKLPGFILTPVSEKAFLCSTGRRDFKQFLVRITKRRKQ